MKQFNLVVLMFLASVIPNSARALEVETSKFGIGGQFLIKHINPVSFQVHNPSNEPYDGTIGLSRGGGFSQDGAMLIKEFYLAPHTSQWVHFYPYFSSEMGTFTFRWGRELRKRIPVDLPKARKIQPVYFSRSDSISSGAGKLSSYSIEFFPPMLAALDALNIVVLDHNPRWQKVRRQVFRDWVYKGGTLHLFQDSNGQYPEFSGELTIFNTPLNSFTVGGGKIFRHARTVQNLDKAYISKKLQSSLSLSNLLDKKNTKEDKNQEFNNNNSYYAGQELDYAQSFFRELRNLTRPDHNWNLIYTLSFIYLLAIFPGCLIMGRKRIDYKIIYLFILFSAGTMSITFWVLGQRGYDEKTMLNSVSIAHSLGDGRYDVKTWNSSFVTSGDIYHLKSGGEGVVYSSCEDNSKVKGTIINGTGGVFNVDIPPFTARTYSDQGVFKVEKPVVKLVEYQAGEKLESLKLVVANESVIKKRRFKALVCYNGLIYYIHGTADKLEIRNNNGLSLKQYLNRGMLDNNNNNFFTSYYWGNNTRDSLKKTYQKMEDPLIYYALGISKFLLSNGEKDDFSSLRIPPENILRVYLYALPLKEFYHEDQVTDESLGRTLYVIDYDLTEKK